MPVKYRLSPSARAASREMVSIVASDHGSGPPSTQLSGNSKTISPALVLYRLASVAISRQLTGTMTTKPMSKAARSARAAQELIAFASDPRHSRADIIAFATKLARRLALRVVK